MALASLIPHHVFGVKSSIKNSMYFTDETTVMYVAGHNLVFWSVDQKAQRIISGTPDTDAITAIAITPNKRQVAVAERLVPAFEKVLRGVSPSEAKAQSPTGNNNYTMICLKSLSYEPCWYHKEQLGTILSFPDRLSSNLLYVYHSCCINLQHIEVLRVESLISLCYRDHDILVRRREYVLNISI